MNLRLLITTLAILLMAGGCKRKVIGDEPKPIPIPASPAITGLSISPSIAREFRDSIVLLIGYQDGDGDLGELAADSSSVFVRDSRRDVVQGYHLQPLAPPGSTIAISGTLRIVMPYAVVWDASAESEQVRFGVTLLDRAGNRSAERLSPEIEVRR